MTSSKNGMVVTEVGNASKEDGLIEVANSKQSVAHNAQPAKQNIVSDSDTVEKKDVVSQGEIVGSQDALKEKEKTKEHSIETETPPPDYDKVYMSGTPFIILTLVLMATILMTALDQNILCKFHICAVTRAASQYFRSHCHTENCD
jgi:hypothetical protein